MRISDWSSDVCSSDLCHRIGAKHQDELAAIDVRHVDQQLMPVQPVADELMRQLIERRRGTAAARLQRTEQRAAVRHDYPVVDAGIAEIAGVRITAMLPGDRSKATGNLAARYVPAPLPHTVVRNSDESG